MTFGAPLNEQIASTTSSANSSAWSSLQQESIGGGTTQTVVEKSKNSVILPPIELIVVDQPSDRTDQPNIVDMSALQPIDVPVEPVNEKNSKNSKGKSPTRKSQRTLSTSHEKT